MAKEKAYSKLYAKLDTKGGGMDYQLPGQRDWTGKDMQQVMMVKDRHGSTLP